MLDRCEVSRPRRLLFVSAIAAIAGLAAAPAALAAPGDINTVAGTGTFDYSGDGGPATSADFDSPVEVAVGSGNLYIADFNNHRVRRVNSSGTVTTVAGTGTAGYSGDGGPATSAEIDFPRGLAVDADGNLYIADYSNDVVREVDGSGTITTVAGTGTAGYSGDGGDATAAELDGPRTLAFDSDGNLYITDSLNNVIRKVGPSGTITTVAGTGTAGYSGDGGDATAAELNQPWGVTLDASGNLYIADTLNNVVRRVNTSGTITTVAGTGTPGNTGNGGPATSALLNMPRGLAVTHGNLYIGDEANCQVRRVDGSGTITAFAGTGACAFSGDGGPATSAGTNPLGIAVDAQGNIYIADSANSRVRKVAESFPPQTTIDSGPSGTTKDPTPTFTFSSSEGGSSFQCRVDSGSFASCSSPKTTAHLADGSHTFAVRAADQAGNTDATPDSRTFTVDATAPETTIDSGPSGTANDPTPTFTFSSSEGGSSFKCKVDSNGYSACASPKTTAHLADGSHTFSVRATDQAGNTDATPDSRTFTVDATAPETTIDSGPSGITNDPTPTFTFSSSEGGSSFQCRVDSGSFASCSSPKTTAHLADGSHTFSVRAADQAGNTDATPDSRTFTVDTVRPLVTIDSGPTGLTNDPEPSFAFSSSKPGSSFECRVDSGSFASCSSPLQIGRLDDGSHTFAVRATDSTGNTGPAVSRRFKVDATAPTLKIKGPSKIRTSKRRASAVFDLKTSHQVALKCRVKSKHFAPCSAHYRTPKLGHGTHTLTVKATDPAGNLTTRSRKFKIVARK